MAARRDLWFESRGGTRCAAWLYEPADGLGESSSPSPCVVLAHGFAGVRVARLDAFAERFAAAGYSALVFDYRFFGDSEGEPRQLLDVKAQLDDWRAAVAFARSLPEVDGDRIALWGTSFSGGHVAAMAAEDPRVVAAISQNPFVDGVWTLRAAGPANILRMTAAGLRDELARLRGRAPVYAPAVGPAGTLAAMTSAGAESGYRALFPAGYSWPNEVTARVFLRVGLYRPAAKARHIRCPWLVQVAEDDLVTPAKPAEDAALRAPRGELRRYPGGHWGIYVGADFDRASADQIEFLHRHVPVATPAAAPA